MFSIVLELVGASMVGSKSSTGGWIVNGPVTDLPKPAPAKVTYEGIMNSNATDGLRFVKPERGHEDGCIAGKCSERVHDEYAQ